MLRDLYAGVCKDGSRPKLISKALIPPLEPEFTPEPLRTAKEPPDTNPILKENRARLGEAEKKHVERIRKSVELNELLVELGIREARRMKEGPADETSATHASETLATRAAGTAAAQADGPPETRAGETPAVPAAGTAAAQADDTLAAHADDKLAARAGDSLTGSSLRDPAIPSPEGAADCSPGRQPGESQPTQDQSPVRGDRRNAPDACNPADGTSATRAGRMPAAREIRGLPLLTLAARAARDLPKLSADLLSAESKWLETDARERVQNAFYLDRAVALVTDLFFHMDEQFAELGFGNWMPFRYPDQWCMFVGLLSRILAAHGLMPAEPGRAEIYRKLLDETPAINEIAETAIRPPKSYGKARANREFPTMQALQDEVFARAAKPP